MSGPVFKIDERDVHEGFFFRPDFADIGKQILTEEQYRNYLEALVEVACYGTCQVEDPYIGLCLHQVVPFIRATNLRYKRCVKNGSRGGRKRSFSDADLIAAIKSGLSTQQQLADHFGCTVRTIARRIKPSSVAWFYRKRKSYVSPEEEPREEV